MGESATYRSTMRFFVESVEGLILLPLIVVTWPVARFRLRDWGSSSDERQRTWPGDLLTPAAVDVLTRTVAISAPAHEVWRWVVQFGLDRAGFYSYELLERMVGIPVRNAESILSAHQVLEVGAEVKLHPKAPGIPVGATSPGRYLCFGRGPDEDPTDVPDPNRSWSLYLEPDSESACRLVLRTCLEAPRTKSVRKRLGLALEVPIDFAMEQRMLRTIKRLSESAVR